MGEITPVRINGELSPESVNAYTKSLDGLSKAEARAALSATTLDEKEKELVISKMAGANATAQLSERELFDALVKSELSEEDALALMQKAGLTTATNVEAISEDNLVKVKAKDILVSKALSGADKETLMNVLGLTAGNVGLAASFKLLAKSTGVMIAISLVISLVTKAFEKLTHAQEDAIKAADEVKDKFNEAQKSLQSNKKTIDSISEDYEKLARGVDSQGRNISLSTEEYEKYNDIVNKIADMFPVMVQGYTDEGNAIIKNKGDVEALTQAYIEQKEAAQAAILVGANKVVKGFKAEVDAEAYFPWQKPGVLQKKRTIDNIISAMDRGVAVGGVLTHVPYANKILEELGLTEKEFSEQWGTDELRKLLNGLSQTYDSTIGAAVASVRPIIQAYLDSSTKFQGLDDKTKDSVKEVVQQLDNEFYTQFDNATQMNEWIEKNIVEVFQGNKELSTKFTATMDLQTKFNSGEIPVGEYVERLNAFLTLTDNLPEETKKAIRLVFGIETDEDGNPVNTVEGMLNRAKMMLAGKFSKELEGLTSDELEILLNLEIPTEALNSWEDIAKLIEDAKKAADDASTSLEELNKQLDGIQSAYDTVKSAIEEYNEQGYLSLDTYQALASITPEYLGYLMDENGALSLNTDELYKNTEALIDNLARKQITNIIDYVVGLDAEKRQLYLTSQATDNASESLAKFAGTMIATKFAAGELTDEQLQGLQTMLASVINWAESAKANLNKGLSKSDSGSSQKDKEDKLAEAWKKEHLETLKEGLKEQEEILNEYKKNLEIFDFGLETVEEDDFSSRADLLMGKIDGIIDYGKAMREEFDRVAETIPETADEAQELANRLETLGSDMRSNVTDLRKTQIELQKLQIDMASSLINDRTKELDNILDNIDKRINILNSEHQSAYKYVNEMLSMDLLLPTYSEADKKRREKRRSDKALIDTEQETQDKINEIVQKSLQMQFDENKKAREKERQELTEDMAKVVKIVSDNMTTAADIANNTQMKPKVDPSGVEEGLGKITERIRNWYEQTSQKYPILFGYQYGPNQVTSNGVIAEARKYLGQHNTNGKFSDGRTEAWCADFVTYITQSLGINNVPRTASVKVLYDYFKTNGRLSKDPVVGSVVMFDWKGNGTFDHVGIVTGFDDNYIYTIEGNTGNSEVAEKTRRRGGSDILGYGLYASGTPLGNAQSSNLGIAGENYKPEILIDKATGEKTYIDSPTVIDTSKTDVIGEKQTANLPKFADGTYDIDEIKKQLEALNEEDTIDFTIRPIVDTSELEKAGWGEQEKGFATVYSSTFYSEDFGLTAGKALVVTPILPNGKVLSPEELEKYAEDILSGKEVDVKIKMGLFDGENYKDDADDFANTVHELHEKYFSDEINEATLGHIQTFYDDAVDAIGRISSTHAKNILDINNDESLSGFEKKQRLYAEKLDISNKASGEIKEIYDNLYNEFINWLDEVDKGTSEWSLEIYNGFTETLNDIEDKIYDLAEAADKIMTDMVESRWKLSDDYISERNFYNDWKMFDDNEVKAWERVVKWLKRDYPEDLEKIKQAEHSLFEARKQYLSDANSSANSYLDSQKTLLQDYFDITNSIKEARHDINKELETSKTMYEWLDEETRELLFNQKDYDKLSRTLSGIQQDALKLKKDYQRDINRATVEEIESITNSYDRQYKALMKNYEIAKADLEIAKKKQKLNNVLNERNVRMFINGSWQWVANTQDVIDAKSELADAEYARRTEESGLRQQKSIDALSAQQDELNLIIKKFENGVIGLDEAIGLAKEAIGDIPKAISQLYKTASRKAEDTVVVKSKNNATATIPGVGDTPVYIDSNNKTQTGSLPVGTIVHTSGGDYRITGGNAGNYTSELVDKEYASGTRYTEGGLTALGEDGFEAYISPNGKLIPITQPTFGDLPSGGIVFNAEQMKELRMWWDISNTGFKGNSGAIGSATQNVDNSQDNRVIINGMTVDSGSADGQALISALRRYVGNH